jgi:hypothetical protein
MARGPAPASAVWCRDSIARASVVTLTNSRRQTGTGRSNVLHNETDQICISEEGVEAGGVFLGEGVSSGEVRVE